MVDGLPAHTDTARAVRRACRTQPALYSDMTALDHLAFGVRCHDGSLVEQLSRSQAYGLEPWLHTSASRLSTGNARKLWVLMSTGGHFDVVLLDEPFNGLDEQGTDALLHELESWSHDRLVVLIAHRLPGRLAPGRVVNISVSSSTGATV